MDRQRRAAYYFLGCVHLLVFIWVTGCASPTRTVKDGFSNSLQKISATTQSAIAAEQGTEMLSIISAIIILAGVAGYVLYEKKTGGALIAIGVGLAITPLLLDMISAQIILWVSISFAAAGLIFVAALVFKKWRNVLRNGNGKHL